MLSGLFRLAALLHAKMLSGLFSYSQLSVTVASRQLRNKFLGLSH